MGFCRQPMSCRIMLQQERCPGFTWDAADYAKSSPVQKHWAQELIRKIPLSGRERVLDIGCGDGNISAVLARRVPAGSVLGIDRSPDMIRFAQEAFPSGSYPNLSFEEGDAQDLRYDGRFDLVFSTAALHWIYNHGPVLAGISRALKSGGRMIVQMGGKGNAAGVVAALAFVIAEPGWARYFSGFSFRYGFFSPEEYRPWLEAAGLCPARAELIPKEMIYPGREGFAGWIRTTWLPYLERVPEDRRPAFVDAVTERYLSLYPAKPDGSICVGMVRLEIEAQKP